MDVAVYIIKLSVEMVRYFDFIMNFHQFASVNNRDVDLFLSFEYKTFNQKKKSLQFVKIISNFSCRIIFKNKI